MTLLQILQSVVHRTVSFDLNSKLMHNFHFFGRQLEHFVEVDEKLKVISNIDDTATRWNSFQQHFVCRCMQASLANMTDAF